MKILSINLGSTSTKIGLFEGEEEIYQKNISHGEEELKNSSTYATCLEHRKNTIEKILSENKVLFDSVGLVVSRGALTRPLESGAYLINSAMIEDLRNGRFGWHASNVGPELALGLATRFNVQAIIYDSPSTDEMDEVARISGLKGIQRKALFHVLNQKWAAKRAAARIGLTYDHGCFVVGHLGGGITICAHKNGRIVDGTHGLSEGPFTPQRTGSLPLLDVIDLCFSGKFTRESLVKELFGSGGVRSYLGTHDMVEVEARAVKGDKMALTILNALAYQVSKEMGAMATALKGRIDAVVLTGNLARSQIIVTEIIGRVKFLGPVMVFPGEEELRALAAGGLAVLKGAEEVKTYPPQS